MSEQLEHGAHHRSCFRFAFPVRRSFNAFSCDPSTVLDLDAIVEEGRVAEPEFVVLDD